MFRSLRSTRAWTTAPRSSTSLRQARTPSFSFSKAQRSSGDKSGLWPRASWPGAARDFRSNAPQCAAETAEGAWQTDYYRRKPRKCRANLWTWKSRRFARTPWWWTQSSHTGLCKEKSLASGNFAGKSPKTRLLLGPAMELSVGNRR
jgi:hypothetical protein